MRFFCCPTVLKVEKEPLWTVRNAHDGRVHDVSELLVSSEEFVEQLGASAGRIEDVDAFSIVILQVFGHF